MKSPAELRWILLAQIIGCALVILGHSFPFVTPYPLGGVNFIRFLYAFHMPLFVWCSGYLFSYTAQTRRKTFGCYLRQRSAKLLIPYFSLSIIGVLPKIAANSVLNDTLRMDALQIVRSFLIPREGIWGHFWFLPMIFLCGTAGYLLEHTFGRSRTAWTLITLAAFALSFVPTDGLGWFALSDVLQLFMFYSLGALCCQLRLRPLPRGWLLPAAIVCTALSVALFFCIDGNWGLHHTGNTLIACLMTAAVVALCKLAEPDVSLSRTSSVAQTYQIFILSWPCQLVVGILIERILHLGWAVFIPTVFLTGLLLPLVLLKAVDLIETKTNTRLLSHILGR